MAEDRHNTVLDQGLQYLGKVYAKALLGAGDKAGITEVVLEELQTLISEVLDPFPKLEETLKSPRVPMESKERVLDQVFRDKVTPQVLNFLKVLVRRGRFNCVRAVSYAARKMFNESQGRIEVHLTTAEPISTATRDLVVSKLQGSLNSQIDLRTHVDPNLLGGLVVRVGDTVYDGSLANQLARLRSELVATATHKMRAEADRFAVAN